MGNKLENENRLQKLERNILNLSGMEVGVDIDVYDVHLSSDNYIHTIRCGDENKEIILLIHGYGGTGILFYKMIKELAKKYKVYCIDLLGMGLSSRPKFECKNAKDSIEFFVDSIDKWRTSLGLEEFILAGHSFGGHIACHFTAKYPEIVKKLFLISPLGFTKYNGEKPNYDKFKMNFFKKQVLKIRDVFFEKQVTMSQVVNDMWYIRIFMKTFIKARLKEKSEVGDWIYEYLIETYKMPESSEKALFLIMNSDFQAHCPLEDIVEKMDIPVTVFFGYSDWMDDHGAQRLLMKKKHNYDVFYIKDAGHQITMENPKGLLSYIVEEEEIVEFV